jgi:hypothetical protein
MRTTAILCNHKEEHFIGQLSDTSICCFKGSAVYPFLISIEMYTSWVEMRLHYNFIVQILQVSLQLSDIQRDMTESVNRKQSTPTSTR